MILVPEPLSGEAFAPFGQIVRLAPQPGEAINAGTAERSNTQATLDLRTASADPVLHVYVAKARTMPLAVTMLERHREGDQSFIPLGRQRFLVVVAGTGETFARGDVRVFVTAPGEGVVYRRGCWHHPLIALGDGDRFLVIEGGGYRGDCEERAVDGPLLVLGPGSRRRAARPAA